MNVTNAANNMIGGTALGARNVISANGFGGAFNPNAGVAIGGSGATGNHVEGNFIGTDASGTSALGNNVAGVTVAGPGNFVGGLTAAQRNVISGNAGSGVFLFSADAIDNHIEGNYVGTNAAGAIGLGNARSGIAVDGGTDNLVGGTSLAARNVVSGNSGNGIFVLAENTTIQGNFIGLNPSGSAGLGNAFYGVQIHGAANALIGG
ncbi:MAG: Calx-beta domain-containing protein, partial [Chloroflexi bacterium]